MTKKELEKQDTQQKRQFTVRKANEIIQKAHSEMTAQQFDILSYLISKIKPGDEPQQTYYFTISEFCMLCNKYKGSGYYYQSIKEDIAAIASVNVWVRQENGKDRLVHWLDDVLIDRGNGTIEISFHRSIYPYLFDLRERFTYYPVEYTLALKSIYAKLLYDLLKSLERLGGEKTLSLEYLKKQLNAENYTRYPDFRRFVLEKAITEINEITDIEVIANPKKLNSRSITHIGFNIKRVDDISMSYYARQLNRQMRLDKELRDAITEEAERLERGEPIEEE